MPSFYPLVLPRASGGEVLVQARVWDLGRRHWAAPNSTGELFALPPGAYGVLLQDLDNARVPVHACRAYALDVTPVGAPPQDWRVKERRWSPPYPRAVLRVACPCLHLPGGGAR